MKLPLILLCTLSFLSSKAQNALAGKVTDSETGSPLPYAAVYIADLKRGALTDSLGNYELNNLPAGKFLLSANFTGYTSENVSVIIQGQTILDIALEPTHMEMEEVVITGVSNATELKRSPIPTVIIGRQQLIAASGANIIAAISGVPGVSQLSTGAGISKPIIRGLGYNRVVTLYDGVRQEGQQWGDEHGIEIDQFSVDRVEILKGPASLMYGSDALGGVLNLLAPYPRAEGTVGGDVQAEYQANNSLYGVSGGLSGNKNGINWLARISRKQAGNFTNRYDGRVYNSGFTENGANGYIGLNKSWGYSHMGFTFFDQVLALPEGERDSASGRFIKEVKLTDSTTEEVIVPDEELRSYEIGVPKQGIRHYRIYSTNTFILGKSRLSANLGFQNNLRKEFGEAVSPDEANLVMDLSSFTYHLKYFFPEAKGWEPVAGVNGMYQVNANKGEEYIIPDYSLLDLGVFALTKKTFEKLDISGGLRFDIRRVSSEALYLKDDEPVTEPDSLTETKFAGFDISFRNVSASLGATYTLAKNVYLKGNIARGFRAPNIAELSANGVHEGTFRYEIGSTGLKPETSVQGDLGFFAESKHVSLDISVFDNHISNYIHLEKILNAQGGDSIIDPEEPLAAAYRFVQGRARLYGGEAVIDIHPHPFDWLHFENTASVVYGMNKESNSEDARYLPFIPAARIRSELRATLAKTKGKLPLKNSFVKIEAEHHFTQDRIFRVGGTETETPAYTLLHAGIGTSLIRKNGKALLDLVITGSNLTDVAYQNHLSRLKYAAENPVTGRTGIYNMGRNFSFTVNVPF